MGARKPNGSRTRLEARLATQRPPRNIPAMNDRIADDAHFALLAEAKTEASVVWDEDERENATQP